jgi:hypothetical protein
MISHMTMNGWPWPLKGWALTNALFPPFPPFCLGCNSLFKNDAEDVLDIAGVAAACDLGETLGGEA